ncbi:MAG: FAD-binding oxidoreductase [Crocinitomicaceae bacterium]|nr:FAD-binding oxidoreductase [Crocinitomicaceae bacterium]
MSTNFHKLSISKITREAAKTVAITFDVPAELEGDFKFKSGQYLTLRADINGEDVRRSYSICSSPNSGDLTVAVKAIENGKFSNYAYDNLKEGDVMDVMAPMGGFVLDEKVNNHLFMAAGSGITPILSMIKDIAESGNGTATLIYGNKTAADTIFKEEIDALNTANTNVTVHYVYSREDSGNAVLNGRIDRAKCADLKNYILKDAPIDGLYLCGPEEMINNAKDYFSLSTLEANQIHFELFTTPTAATEESKGGADEGINVNSNVTVIIDDEEYEFLLNTEDKDVLQAAQDMGADVPFSCKGGVCCTCRAKILEGTAKMDLNFALEESEVEEGFILTCQAHPTSETLVVSFDEY